MNKILKGLAEKAADAGSLAQSIVDSGVRSVAEVCSGTKIFGALAVASEARLEHDETHYILVPLLGGDQEYAIYTKRVLPLGVGTTNSLPKLRIFHVPDESGKELLEQRLISEMLVGDCRSEVENESGIADLLEKVADQIDRETTKISGGLLLIGGVVALANPLLGAGIVVKGLMPSIGAKASKAGAEYMGDKLRNWKKSSEDSRRRKCISKDVKRLKPLIYPNPIVRSLEAIATNPQTDFDPDFDRRNWFDAFEEGRYYTITTEAIGEVYKDILEEVDREKYQDLHLRWVQSFVDNGR